VFLYNETIIKSTQEFPLNLLKTLGCNNLKPAETKNTEDFASSVLSHINK